MAALEARDKVVGEPVTQRELELVREVFGERIDGLEETFKAEVRGIERWLKWGAGIVAVNTAVVTAAAIASDGRQPGRLAIAVAEVVRSAL